MKIVGEAARLKYKGRASRQSTRGRVHEESGQISGLFLNF